MANVRRFLSHRRLLTFISVLALLFGLAMLHPYPRQSLFGPTIRGEPWCVWEDEIRRHARPEDHNRSWMTKLRRLIGVEDVSRIFALHEFEPELLPLLLQLSRDPDEAVRGQIVDYLDRRPILFRHPSACEVLFERLKEKDHYMRTTAAIGHWCVFKDTRVFDIMIRDVCNQEIVLSRRGLLTNPLKEICEKDRSFLPKVAKVLESEHIIRCQFLMDIVCFGRDAVPHLVRGLQDESAMIRERSVDSLSRLRGDALDASPVLEEMLTNNRDVALWPAVHRALQIINPARFPEQPDK